MTTQDYQDKFIQGSCLETLPGLPDACADMCVTSPPYYNLRDYGVDGQLGLEGTPEAYISRLVEVFREVRRVLKDDGTLWVNIGDSYANDAKWGGSSGASTQKRCTATQALGARKPIPA